MLPGDQFVIMGFYWEKDLKEAFTCRFIGEITFFEKDKFRGVIEQDPYGLADIIGDLDGGILRFVKKYSPFSKGGTDKPIVFSFVVTGSPAQGAGGMGNYIVKEAPEYPNTEGKACCIIFPKPQ